MALFKARHGGLKSSNTKNIKSFFLVLGGLRVAIRTYVFACPCSTIKSVIFLSVENVLKRENV